MQSDTSNETFKFKAALFVLFLTSYECSRHDAVAEFLCERGATLVLSNFDAGILMCQAAFSNDIVQVKRLIRNKVSPSAADYDGRSGLVR